MGHAGQFSWHPSRRRSVGRPSASECSTPGKRTGLRTCVSGQWTRARPWASVMAEPAGSWRHTRSPPMVTGCALLVSLEENVQVGGKQVIVEGVRGLHDDTP